MIDRLALRHTVLACVLGSSALFANAQTSEPQPPTAPTPAAQPAAPAAPASSVDDDRASIQLAFTRADADGDGKLSLQEAGRLPAVAARFSDLDTDKDGFISNAEFNAGVRIQR